MAWIESHQQLRDHPKVLRLSRLLDVHRTSAVGLLHFLWWWALDHAEDGDLSDFDALDLALAAGWEGDPDGFVKALKDCGPGDRNGFLAESEDGLILHDWWDYAGKLVERRQKDRDRKRKQRETSDDRPKDVRGTSEGTPTVPNRTQPNQKTTTSDVPSDPDVSDAARTLTRQFAKAVKDNGHPIPSAASKARRDWLIAMDRLLRLGPPGEGGHVPDEAEVARVIEWCAADTGSGSYPGESVVVRSVPKFRERYSELRRKAGVGQRSATESQFFGGVPGE